MTKYPERFLIGYLVCVALSLIFFYTFTAWSQKKGNAHVAEAVFLSFVPVVNVWASILCIIFLLSQLNDFLTGKNQ